MCTVVESCTIANDSHSKIIKRKRTAVFFPFSHAFLVSRHLFPLRAFNKVFDQCAQIRTMLHSSSDQFTEFLLQISVISKDTKELSDILQHDYYVCKFCPIWNLYKCIRFLPWIVRAASVTNVTIEKQRSNFLHLTNLQHHMHHKMFFVQLIHSG